MKGLCYERKTRCRKSRRYCELSLERAYETLKEVDYNTEGGYYNAAVNRLYYACYYAASALLLSCEIEANTHNGVKTQLSMLFVRTGRWSLDHGATFSLLFEKRQASDYSDFAYCDLALVNTLRPRAEAFYQCNRTTGRSRGQVIDLGKK